MAGRPINPNWTVEPWAPDTNYAAGALPWSGTPTKVAWAGAPSVGITPKTGFPAQAFNYAINKITSNAQASKDVLDEQVTYTGQMHAMNWQRHSIVNSFTVRGAAYNPVDRRWYVIGDNISGTSQVRSSFTWGKTWTDTYVDAVDAGEDCRALDYAANGDMVVTTTGRYVFMRLAGTWSRQDVHASAIGTSLTCCAHDPIRGLYVAAAGVVGAAAAPLVRTSSNGTSWTIRTSPFAVSGDGPMTMHCRKDTGRIVWVTLNGSSTGLLISYSDDGGVTWSSQVTISAGFIAWTTLALHYNPTTQKWMIIIGNTSTGARVYVSSDNGATWSLQLTLATAGLGRGLASFGRMWVTLSAETVFSVSNTQVVYSLDDGATWKRTGQGFDTSLPTMFGSEAAGGFMGVGSDTVPNAYAFASVAMGLPNLGTIA